MTRCCSMLALLPLLVPLPANPPRRLPMMRDFWQRWTNLKPPPSFPTDDPQKPSASLPAPTISANGMTTEARTNLGPPAASPADAPRNIHRLVTRSGCGDNLLPRRSDIPRAAASPANRWSTDGSKARCPLRALSMMPWPPTTDAGTKLGPPATVADGKSSGSLPPRRISGQGGNLPPRRPDTPRATAIVTSR